MDSISSGEGWFHIGSDGQGEVAIYLFGEIPADAEEFFAELGRVQTVKNVSIYLNSEGGNIASALGIANTLHARRVRGSSITCIVEGFAGSASLVILAVANEVRMAPDAFLNIHSAFYPDNRPADARLNDANEAMIWRIAAKAERSKEEIRGLLEADTWLSAEEALSLGFADAVSAVD